MTDVVSKYDGMLDKYVEKGITKHEILLELSKDIRLFVISTVTDVIDGIPDASSGIYKDEYDEECAIGGITYDREVINDYLTKIKNVLIGQS
jgi:hypothetical protein